MNDKEIEFVVNAQSCEESNLFLRKFYDLMAETDKMGWCIEPYREEQKIFIGYNNFEKLGVRYCEISVKTGNTYIEAWGCPMVKRNVCS